MVWVWRLLRSSLISLTVLTVILSASVAASAAPGDIYVGLCCMGDSIIRVTPQGVASVFETSGVSTPFALAFDPAGNLYVTNSGDNTVEKFSPTGMGSVFADLTGPRGLVIDALGNLYVSTANDTIEKIAPDGTASVFASSGLSGVLGLAMDAAGNIFAANSANNTVEKFSPAGVASLYASTSLALVDSLAIDRRGNLFVGDFLSGAVEEITPSRTQTVFAATVGGEPEGLAFDSPGNLLVATGGNSRVVSIAPDGVQSTVADNLYVATSLAVEPASASSVSEPGAITLLLLGLTGLGIVARPSRRARSLVQSHSRQSP